MNLKQAVRKAYRATDRFTIDSLLAEQTRWQRRATIAQNKLASVRRKIDQAAVILADKQLEAK